MRWWPHNWWPHNWWPCHVDRVKAEQEAAEADRKLAEVEDRDPEIRQVIERLDRIRRRNQFGPMIEEAFRERRRRPQ